MPWNERIKRKLKLSDLDILMAVVQTGSMGRASVQLHISQPAVSKAIADLERTFGVRLLHRSRRGAEPTPYGSALVKRAYAVFDEIRRSVEDIDFISDPTAGDIRIGTTEPLAAAIVSPVISQLSWQYPRISFHVSAADTRTLYRQLFELDIELVISRIPDAAAKDLSVEVLFDDPLVVAAAKSNPLTRRRKVEFAELMDASWVIQPSDNFFGSLGGQAIVGNVETPGGEFASKSKDQPHAIAHTPGISMPSADTPREPVPVASDAEWPMPDARGKIPRSTEGK